MSILKYKYKAHRLVNTLFYVIVFIIGFLLGFTSNKIDFSKLLSQVLMIDNVSAYTIYEYDDIKIDEEYIYNKFISLWEDFDIKTYNNIFCVYDKHSNSNEDDLECRAFTDESINNMFFLEGSYSINFYSDKVDYYYFEYKIKKNTFNNYFLSESKNSDHFLNNIFIYPNIYNKGNFNAPHFTDEQNSQFNVLDFNKYVLDFKLNDGSIFEDENHQDFKKYCWDNFSELMFSISIDSSYDGSFNIHYDDQQEGETYVESGFYVFDDISNLKRGTRIKALGVFDYDKYSSTWLSGATFNHLQDITTEFELLHTDEKLGLRYSSIIDALGNYDISRGDSYYYDNIDKLRNAHYVDFTYYYNVLDDFRYDIFYLNEQKENFCIYVPKIFVVTTLDINELGGFIGDIPIHTDDTDSFIDVSQTTGKLHFNNLFSIINQFISSIKDTVILINNFIYSLFLSLPPLVQMFIFTIITLIVIKTIIWMVVK